MRWQDNECVPGSTDFCSPCGHNCGQPCNPGYGPDCGCTPVPIPSPCHPKCGPGPVPIPPPIMPVVKPLPGCNPAQQMAVVVDKTNECISRWNFIQANCFKALNDVVGAAKSNDVYYDCDEVRLEQGYSTEDSAIYHIVRINKFDKRGCPIIVRLGLAYDNTTNPNVKQSMADFSFVKSANAIMTAVNPSQTGWNGPAMYKGMQIPGGTAEDSYIAGFNRLGVLKTYLGNVEFTNLCQDQVVNILGAAIPIVLDGNVTSQAQELTTKSAVTAIGYNSSIGQTIMFATSFQDNPGMQGITVANTMKELGCTTAVITAIQTEATNGSIGMSYMGRWTDTPISYEEPQAVAFWYVSKRPEHGFCNDFEHEIADLVQKTGMTSNGITELRDKVETAQNTADEALSLAQENADKIATLEADVDNLKDRMDTAEGNIAQLQTDLRNEISNRIAADNALGTRIDNEIQDRENADQQLQNNINQEAQAREEADQQLQGAIDAEESAREQADQNLQQQITTISGDITEINQTIENITNGTTTLNQYVLKAGDTMTGPLVLSGNPTENMQAATKQYVDNKLGSLPIATASTLGTVKVGSGLNITADGTLSATGGGGGTGDYLPLSGGTMSGDIVMSDGTSVEYGSSGSTYNDNGNIVVKAETGKVVAMGQELHVQAEGGTAVKVTGVANGTSANDAVNFSQLQTKADQTALDGKADKTDLDALEETVNGITGGTTALPYVKKAGDTMTGTLKMENGAQVQIVGSGSSVIAHIAPFASGGDTGATFTLPGKNAGITLLPNDTVRIGSNTPCPVKNVADPTEDQDAATKHYVDSVGGSGIAGDFLQNTWKKLNTNDVTKKLSIGLTNDILTNITELGVVVELTANQQYSGNVNLSTGVGSNSLFLGYAQCESGSNVKFILRWLVTGKEMRNGGTDSINIDYCVSSAVPSHCIIVQNTSMSLSSTEYFNGTVTYYWR